MNNQEAKFILSAYRPRGEDAADPKVAEALEQVRRDPELAEWFADERAFDVAFSDIVCSTGIPPELRGNILAGGKISRPRLWRTRPVFLALAAAIVLLAAVAGVWTSRESRLEAWQKDALAVVPAIVEGQSNFDHESNDGRVLQEWLQAQQAPAPEALPIALQALPALGCKTILSGGKPVSIICFKLHSGELVHLVVTDGSQEIDAPREQPLFVRQDGWNTALWSENGRACMLATKAPQREIRDLLVKTAQTKDRRPLLATKI